MSEARKWSLLSHMSGTAANSKFQNSNWLCFFSHSVVFVVVVVVVISSSPNWICYCLVVVFSVVMLWFVCECAFALRCNWLFIWNTWISLFDRFDLFPFHLMLFKLVPDIVCVRRCVFFFIFSKPLFSIFILLVSFHSIISFVSFFPQQLYQARNKILLTNEKKHKTRKKEQRKNTHPNTKFIDKLTILILILNVC